MDTEQSALERIANWLETSGGKLSRTQVQEMVQFARSAASAALGDAEGQAEMWEEALDEIASQLPNLPDEPQVEDIVLAVSRMAAELYALKEGWAGDA